MTRFVLGLAVATVAIAGPASLASAKNFNIEPFLCEDGKQATVRPGTKPVGSVTVTGMDNAGQCVVKCLSTANCNAINMRHVPDYVAKTDNTVCTFYGTKAVGKTNYLTIKNKQWGAVCIRK